MHTRIAGGCLYHACVALGKPIKAIAGDIKLSPATVRRAIKDLRKAGLIETKQRYREKGGKSTLLFSVYHR